MKVVHPDQIQGKEHQQGQLNQNVTHLTCTIGKPTDGKGWRNNEYKTIVLLALGIALVLINLDSVITKPKTEQELGDRDISSNSKDGAN